MTSSNIQKAIDRLPPSIQLSARIFVFAVGLLMLADSGMNQLPISISNSGEFLLTAGIFCFIYGALGLMALSILSCTETDSRTLALIKYFVLFTCVLPVFVGATVHLIQITYCSF
jgi:hypothetical protein